MNIMNEDQTARCVGLSREAETDEPYLLVEDHSGKELLFHCASCRSFWADCGCCGRNLGFGRNLSLIEQQLRPMFCEKPDVRDVKWRKMWKILIHLLTGKDPKKPSSNNCINEEVPLQQFIILVKRFGCVEKLEKPSSEEDDDDDDDDDEARQECFLLEEVQRLMKNTTAKTPRGIISWFGGHMTASDAEDRLRNEEEGTFLVRLSESRADEGGFVVAVKAENSVVQYQIVGEPEKMGKDLDGEYNNRFHLIINGEKEEESFPNLVTFIEERCKHQDIEEGICCKKICKNLPLNTDFNGYR